MMGEYQRLQVFLFMIIFNVAIHTVKSQAADEGVNDAPMSESIDQMIVDAANSSREFEFFYDEGQSLLKVEYDMIYTFQEWEEMEIANGYLNESTASRKKRTAGIINGRGGGRRWTNNIVPYQLSSDFSGRDINTIRAAIGDWERYTCLDFRQQRSGNRIYMKNGGGCYSRVGMVGGAQELGLAPGCRHKGVVIHEIGHALGLHHEQTRPDRDDHVIIVRRNIPSRMYYNFQKNTWNTIMNMGIPYDYTSIMHYGKTAFSVNGQLTIQTKNPSMQNVIGNRQGLSFRDIKSVNIMYNCKRNTASCTKTDNDCPGEGFVDKNCQCVCPGSGLSNPTTSCSGGGGGRVTTARPRPTQRPRPTPRPTTRPRPTGCRDQNRHCSAWADRGECNANPTYMNVYCKQSCHQCGTRPTVSCQDKHYACGTWRSYGYCTRSYAVVVRPLCKRSCGLCGRTSSGRGRGRGGHRTNTGSTNCRDNDNRCPGWARVGECHKNPAYMLPNCRLSCHQCSQSTAYLSAGTGSQANCRDGSSYCSYWANTGECSKNPVYMNSVCRASCSVC